jgi:hypothetical protein
MKIFEDFSCARPADQLDYKHRKGIIPDERRKPERKCKMKYSDIKADFIGKMKILVSKTDKPTAGKVGAIATVATIRDRIAGMKDIKSAVADLNELVQDINQNGADDGFASNSSAAAKAAGVKNVQSNTDLAI